jgi:GTP-binding protein Era
MLHTAITALDGADVILLLVDATRPGEAPPAAATDVLRARRERLVVAINKIDAGSSDAIRALTSWSVRELGIEPLLVSAAAGQGLDVVLERLTAYLPQSPFLFPEDELATQSVRFFVEELVRETIFEEYDQEIPYASAVRIEEYREASDPIFIRAVIYVERVSQKAILVGHGGAGIRTLGTRARQKIEAFIGSHVYLDLWVKTLPGWRRKAGALKYLGYVLPPEERDQRQTGGH